MFLKVFFILISYLDCVFTSYLETITIGLILKRVGKLILTFRSPITVKKVLLETHSVQKLTLGTFFHFYESVPILLQLKLLPPLIQLRRFPSLPFQLIEKVFPVNSSSQKDYTSTFQDSAPVTLQLRRFTVRTVSVHKKVLIKTSSAQKLTLFSMILSQLPYN